MKSVKFAGIILFYSFFALHLMSCRTTNPDLLPGVQKSSFEETLNSAINKITYDEAIMTWGEPASVFQGDEIFIATWGDAKSGGAVFPIGNTWFAIPIEKGWKLQLSFNKVTRKMVRWIYVNGNEQLFCKSLRRVEAGPQPWPPRI